MRLRVEHTTRFEYSEPVHESVTEVRLQPVDNRGSGQHCTDFRLTVSPSATVFAYNDYYGNNVHHFSILPHHSSLQIVASSVVDTGANRLPAEEGDAVKLFDYLAESRYVRFDPAVRQFAEQFRGIADQRQLADAVCARINQVLIYEPGVTGVHSTSAEVIALGRGVCQDFTQLMLATLRYLGVPSRYVSGYVYNGNHSETREQASHAWCEVYDGPETGWFGYDPTHNSYHVEEHYIRIGTGRDYADIPPVRGTYKGNATERLKVTVRIAPA